jgi:CRP/FNR family transcriptional regulator, cyclic AMP receptor protein
MMAAVSTATRNGAALIPVLSAVRIFQHLSRVDLARIAQVATVKRVAAHSIVFFEGNRADAFFVVLSGALKVFQTANDGRVRVLGTIGPGETFGELAMLDGQPRSASVETIGASELLVIARDDWRRMATTTPGILWGMLENVCTRLRAQNDSELGALLKRTEYRVSKAILELAEKYGESTGVGVRIPATFGVNDIAEMAASTVPRVERALEKLEDLALISVVEGECVLRDVSAVRRALAYM